MSSKYGIMGIKLTGLIPRIQLYGIFSIIMDMEVDKRINRFLKSFPL